MTRHDIPAVPTASADRSEDIDRATMRATVRRGLSAVSLVDIAAEADLAVGAVRSAANDDVHGLVLATYQRELDRLADTCAGAYCGTCWHEALRAVVRVVLQRAVDDPVSARFVYLEVPSGGFALLRRRDPSASSWAVRLADRWSDVSGERPSPLHLEMIAGAVRHTVQTHLRADALERLVACVEDLCRTFDPPAAFPATTP